MTKPQKSTNRDDYQAISRPFGAMAKDFAAGERIGWHWHTRAQLLYAVSGVMEVTIGDDLWIIPPSLALWIPAGVAHSTLPRSPLSVRTLYVVEAVQPRELSRKPQAVQISPLLRELIVRATELPMEYDEAEMAPILTLLMREMEASSETPVSLPRPSDPRLLRVYEKLLEDPADRRSLPEWAKAVGASERTLARLAQKEFEMPFAAWMRQLRMFSALPRLAAGEPVTSIALDLGYQTPSAFTAMFSRMFGRPPRAFFPKG